MLNENMSFVGLPQENPDDVNSKIREAVEAGNINGPGGVIELVLEADKDIDVTLQVDNKSPFISAVYDKHLLAEKNKLIKFLKNLLNSVLAVGSEEESQVELEESLIVVGDIYRRAGQSTQSAELISKALEMLETIDNPEAIRIMGLIRAGFSPEDHFETTAEDLKVSLNFFNAAAGIFEKDDKPDKAFECLENALGVMLTNLEHAKNIDNNEEKIGIIHQKAMNLIKNSDLEIKPEILINFDVQMVRIGKINNTAPSVTWDNYMSLVDRIKALDATPYSRNMLKVLLEEILAFYEERGLDYSRDKTRLPQLNEIKELME